MTPLDLKSKEEWEKILDRLAQDSNMTACLMDDKGAMLFCRTERYKLCAAIRGDSEATTFICSRTNAAMLAVVEKTLRPLVDFCEAGLLRMVIPVLYQGAMVGQLTACGLSSEEDELDSFLVARQLGVPEEKVLELAKSTPAGSQEDLQELAERLFEELNPQES